MLQHAGMQFVREVPDRLGERRACAPAASRPSGRRSGRAPDWLQLAFEPAQHDADAGQLLADVVVQVARDARALRLPGRRSGGRRDPDSVRRSRDSGARSAQRELPCGAACVRWTTRPAISALCNPRTSAAADDVRSVLIPDARLPEPDEASRGQARLADAPALELAPVEHRLSVGLRGGLDAARRFAAQNAHGRRSPSPDQRPRPRAVTRRRCRDPAGCRTSRKSARSPRHGARPASVPPPGPRPSRPRTRARRKSPNAAAATRARFSMSANERSLDQTNVSRSWNGWNAASQLLSPEVLDRGTRQ